MPTSTIDKDLKPLYEAAIEQGWQVTEENGKLKWFPPDKTKSLVSTANRVAPGRQLKNVEKQLVRAGLVYGEEKVRPANDGVEFLAAIEDFVGQVLAEEHDHEHEHIEGPPPPDYRKHASHFLDDVSYALAEYTSAMTRAARHRIAELSKEQESWLAAVEKAERQAEKARETLHAQQVENAELKRANAELLERANSAERRLKAMRDALSGDL